MSDIFLSYAREDAERAGQLAAALQAQGWSVFWDLTIPPGRTWRQVIGAQLEAAGCVVVAWSRISIGRHWVLEEADSGLERGVLVPLLLDAVKPPLGFRSIQAADFRDWQGDAEAAAFRRLVEAVADKIGRPGLGAVSANAAPLAPAATLPQKRARVPRRSLAPAQPVLQAGGEPPSIQPDPRPNPPQPFSILRHTLRDGTPGPEMVLIPAGEFRMGDLDGSGYDNEKPVHIVRLPRPFYLGRYAVTFDEYDHYAKDSGVKLPDDRGWGRGNRPVIKVSWQDAVAYCAWLSKQTGQAYRLPSEAEWEYAARAGTETAYWWGNEAGQNRANFDGSGSQWSNRQTAPVGSFPPNPWGLHDTAGNVWEWVQDRWHDDYQGAPVDGSAWEQGDSSMRVLRGGSWSSLPRRARAACRNGFVPGSRDGLIGFRLALCAPHR